MSFSGPNFAPIKTENGISYDQFIISAIGGYIWFNFSKRVILITKRFSCKFVESTERGLGLRTENDEIESSEVLIPL